MNIPGNRYNIAPLNVKFSVIKVPQQDRGDGKKSLSFRGTLRSSVFSMRVGFHASPRFRVSRGYPTSKPDESRTEEKKWVMVERMRGGA